MKAVTIDGMQNRKLISLRRFCHYKIFSEHVYAFFYGFGSACERVSKMEGNDGRSDNKK